MKMARCVDISMKIIAILKLRGNVFGGMTDLESIEEHFSHYDLLEQEKDIRGILDSE